MEKKAFKGLTVLSMASVLTLAACGTDNNNDEAGATGGNDAGGSGNNESAENNEKEDVTLDFMHLWPQGSSPDHYRIVSQIIEEFEEMHPHVNVELEVLENEQYKNKMQVISSSNQLPDVGMTWPAGYLEPYVNGDMFAPLDDILDEDGLRDDFVAGTLEAYEMNDNSYALPLELNIAPVFYNKAIFDEYGVDVPETFDDFMDAVETFTENDMTPIALGNRDRWTGSLWYMYLADRIGGPDALNAAIDRSGSFENEGLIEAADRVVDMVENDAFLRGFNGLSDQEAKSEFMNSNAAMYLIGSWDLPNYTTNEEVPQEFRDSVGFFKFPEVDGGQGDIDSWVGGPGVGLFVAENSDIQEEAKAFVKYFSEEWGKYSVEDAGVIPGTQVDTEAVDLPDLFIEVLDELNNASNITLFADVQMSAGVAETHLNQIQALFGEAVTPEDFAREHEEALSEED
ncbi:extracellular solute-binding protein [Salisediminibacterium beveridgei]|uniref:ABC transporter, substrate-binding protein n=1 Tax=Salisediminibacterium beveridgei TaxID=632773 RepID=A0A1D7QXL9_9BACI|nr:extracellular solute-binding protein [Salisediminibacterium beveridgei]AOM83750.1 ABC transporter, substrate-binding protein [Salisediminibacterium beveridgei]